MSRIYMYPKNNYETLESPNPYVKHLEKSLSIKHAIVNQTPNNMGVLDLFLYLRKTDIYFFNWIETIPVNRFGKIQTLILPLFVLIAKILQKKIIWVLHNKFSHENKNTAWISYCFKLMIKKSDWILTHSNEGLEFMKKEFYSYAHKVNYIIHPVSDYLAVRSDKRKLYDLLIWGTIHPYKGVVEFLRRAHNSIDFKNIRIVLSGICPDPNERNQLEGLLNDKIRFIEEFQSMEDLSLLAARSKYVLFTYNSDSVLSSGSLMDTIRMGSKIIGPDKGAFKDLKSNSFILTYNSIEDIPNILKTDSEKSEKLEGDIKLFCEQNSWDNFGSKLFEASNGIL